MYYVINYVCIICTTVNWVHKTIFKFHSIKIKFCVFSSDKYYKILHPQIFKPLRPNHILSLITFWTDIGPYDIFIWLQTLL